MQIPKTIKIGGHEIDVLHQEWSTGLLGSSHIVPNKIYINSASCQSQQEATLLHEILEHINDVCDLQLAHSQISTLETMLYQVLVDNNLCFGQVNNNA